MKKLLFFMLFLVSIPILIINYFYTYRGVDIVTGFENNIIKKQENNVTIRVLNSNNEIKVLNIEDYLIGVVSSEVPVSFEKEALKAQAVASRTYALKQIEDNKDKNYDVTDNVLSQVYSTDDALKEKWGSNFDEYYNKIKTVVNETKGEFISYDNNPIFAFFFSTSNGTTEDNVNVFGADLPYLKPVDSSFDLDETNYVSTKEYTIDEFYNLLGIPVDDLEITNIKRSNSNRVLYLEINGVSFKGRELQKILSLKSNDFDIKEENNKIIITTKGYGHGVGMSQYGANALAKKNMGYQDILKYYYRGVEIKKL
ncbi:MAG: stage II sporulation protein D [Bacilli bacterium]|nr:stage II sporulation protein D [Bacilli bacterium]